ncbi:MAG: hypothetical protein M3362_22050 [Acidobacteriota bacterium]|nr:hypothetical protein [Acidobacteriota bacterium]
MFDELLDSASFGELNQGLELVLERIERIEDDPDADEDNPLLDIFYNLANKIIERMDLIIREHGRPEALAEWDKVMKGYEERFRKYEDALLEEDTLLDFE